MTARAGDLAGLEDAIGYRFTDRGLLRLALTHASAGDGALDVADNERLEFLGDRVLGLIIAERLYRQYDESEAGLAPRLNALVNREACAVAARRARLGDYLVLSKSEEAQGGRDKSSILAGACEAILAALYLDGGLAAASGFIQRFWAEDYARRAPRPQDAKSQLQEWAQRGARAAPVYRLIDRRGPDHDPRFEIDVIVADLPPARGVGRSKQAAERAAAQALLERLGAERGHD